MQNKELRIIDAIRSDPKFNFYEKELSKFRAKVAAEFIDKCKHGIEVIKKYLPFPFQDVARTRMVYLSTEKMESRVFIYKTLGDFNRHL
mmetsp:Transcript_30314/g.29812  ORF Transcript_30314/g.29812 Transcript_30314/m.29812 type:complete len:89 (+) Transcript_30314:101-367(+)